MNYATTLMLLLGCLSLAACGDEHVDLVDTTDGADSASARQGDPETDGTETRYEKVLPEWEETESGEVADGDQ